MVLRVDSDAEEACASRPKRVPVPSAKVISVDNAADQELPSHRRAHIANCTATSSTTANTPAQAAQPVIPPPSHASSCNVTGQKRARGPDTEDLDHAESTDLDEESDPPAPRRPSKKRHQKGICLILLQLVPTR